MKKFNFFLLLGIITIAYFLRVWEFPVNYMFSGELGKEMLYIRQFALSGSLPVIGMPTSHEWLSYGPIYYWIMIPVFNLMKGSPYMLFWVSLITSLLGLAINYLVVRKITDEATSLISTFLQAVSPILIWQTALSKLHTFFFILSPLFMYSLFALWSRKKVWVFWSGVIFGVMFSFHFSQIPLLAVVALLFLTRNYKFSDWVKFGAGSLIPNLTFIWQDKLFAAWVPYRIFTYVGKNLAETKDLIIEFFGRNFFWSRNLWIWGFAVFACILIHYVWKNWRQFTKDFMVFYIISSVIIITFANILHAAPPVHYFLPIFTTVPIFLAVYLRQFRFWFLPVLAVLIINFGGYFTFEKPDDFVPIAKQISIVDAIIKDSGGKPFSIKRVGPYDYFPESYSQNYQYLAIWRGGVLDKSGESSYTINDYTNTYSKEK